MPGLFAYKLVAYKKEGYIKKLTPVSFVGRDAKFSCFIYGNMVLKVLVQGLSPGFRSSRLFGHVEKAS